MINEIIMSFRGMNVAKLLSSYFCGNDGSISEPLSIGFMKQDGTLISLEADNNGGIRITNDLEGLFFDEKLGYVCIAPLSMAFKEKLSGNEKIKTVSMNSKENLTIIKMTLDNSTVMSVFFEDDETYFSIS